MPLYEYHCPDCGKDFDEFRPLALRDAEGLCPSCGGKKSERKLSLISANWGSHLGGSEDSASSCGSGGFT